MESGLGSQGCTHSAARENQSFLADSEKVDRHLRGITWGQGNFGAAKREE